MKQFILKTKSFTIAIAIEIVKDNSLIESWWICMFFPKSNKLDYKQLSPHTLYSQGNGFIGITFLHCTVMFKIDHGDMHQLCYFLITNNQQTECYSILSLLPNPGSSRFAVYTTSVQVPKNCKRCTLIQLCSSLKNKKRNYKKSVAPSCTTVDQSMTQ